MTIPTLEELTFRRVAHDRYGYATPRYTWQALKADGEILTSGQATRRECERDAAYVLKLARQMKEEA